MNGQGTQQKTHHVCFEGTLACSGVNPCPHCLDVVNREVLAQAMKNTTETMVQARGPHGSVAIHELNATSFWAIFYGHYTAGWAKLHQAMMNDPEVARRAFDLRTLTILPPVPVPSAPLPQAAPIAAPHHGMTGFAVRPFAPVPPPAVTPAKVAVDPFGTTQLPAFAASYEMAPDPALPVVPHETQQIAQGSDVAAPAEDEPLFGSLVGPADIRREITADDIAAGATVLEGLSTGANGASNPRL